MTKKTKDTQSKIMLPMLQLLGKNFFEHGVGKNAAALAYYLLFAIFPLLIFLSNVLGILDLNVVAITQSLQRILPKDIVGLIEAYLEHVSKSSSQTLLWFALVFSIWFPMRAVKGLIEDVRLAYHMDKPKQLVTDTIQQLIYTVGFLLVIGVTLALSTFGKHVLEYITFFLPKRILPISDYLLEVWQYVRFIPIGLLMFAVLGSLYTVALDKRQPIKEIGPGIVLALVSWLLVSVGFSFYVENFANYSLIYGTLGAVIVLLMWLYMTAIILIMGAEVNAALLSIRTEKN